MRGVMAVPLLLLLAACEKEPSFDERYAAAAKAVSASGVAIDRELQAREQWRAAEEAGVKPSGGATGSPADPQTAPKSR